MADSLGAWYVVMTSQCDVIDWHTVAAWTLVSMGEDYGEAVVDARGVTEEDESRRAVLLSHRPGDGWGAEPELWFAGRCLCRASLHVVLGTMTHANYWSMLNALSEAACLATSGAHADLSEQAPGGEPPLS